MFRGLPNNPVRHLKIVKNEIIMKEVQNRDWQYLVESVIILAENDKSHLKPHTKNIKKKKKKKKKKEKKKKKIIEFRGEFTLLHTQISPNKFPYHLTKQMELKMIEKEMLCFLSKIEKAQQNGLIL